jgi:beta-lactamase regulating signal transducer with metallopeptidase domain
MIERILFEYLVNALWQLPLLLVGAWLLIRIARPPLLMQHLLWLFTLLAAVILPAHGWTDLESTPTTVQLADNAGTSQIDPVSVTFIPLESNTLASTPTPVGPSMLTRLAADLPLHTGRFTVSATVVHWSVIIYGMLVMLCLIKLLVSCFAALRIRSSSLGRPLTLLESNLLKECARRIHLSHDRLPDIRSLTQSDISPMIIGIRRPVLLLPESLRHSSDPTFEEEHLIAILTHELTHVRRRDYLVNLVARVASLPVAWHPAVMAMHSRIRQTREMICDANAASIFPASTVYARSLLTLAESIIQPHPHVEAVGLFDRNRKTLEERIMKLTEPQLCVPLAARVTRIAAGAFVLLAATMTAATLHLKPAAPAVYAAQTALQTSTPAQTTGQSAPPSDTVSVQTPAPHAAPSPAQTPAPAPDPKPKHKIYIDGDLREMTPEEQAKFDEQMARMREQLNAAMSQINTAKLQDQIEGANIKALKSLDLNKQLDAIKESLKALNDPAVRDQMAKLNTPEFEKQMDDLKLKIKIPELKKQMDDLKIQLDDPKFKDKLKLDMPVVVIPDLQGLGQVDGVTIRLNKPEFKARMAAAQAQLQAQIKQAGSDPAAIQKAVDQFEHEVEAATKDLTRERSHATPPTPPQPPTPPPPPSGTF